MEFRVSGQRGHCVIFSEECRKGSKLTVGSARLWWFGTASGQTLQTVTGGGGGWLRKDPPV